MDKAANSRRDLLFLRKKVGAISMHWEGAYITKSQKDILPEGGKEIVC